MKNEHNVPVDSLTGEGAILDAIDNAEEVTSPLDDLVERCTKDPGALCDPNIVETLKELKLKDCAAFERLRAQLKAAGCRVAVLDEIIAEPTGRMENRRPSQAEMLIQLAQSAELFHTPDQKAYADVDINGHRATLAVQSRQFKKWLYRRCYKDTGCTPNSEALQSALTVIEAKAEIDGPERKVHVRIGSHLGKIYLDLADDAWRSVEIDEAGWRVVDRPPVRFRRAPGMKALPVPTRGGSIDTLRSFLNVGSHADFVLVVSWLLACLRDRGPYPLIVLSGEQGSAKSTFSGILKELIDPNTSPMRALPSQNQDLFIAATNGHVLAFDNVSGLPSWLSDNLCRLSTGGAFAVRALYTDDEEKMFEAVRPIILNGIEDVVTRPDLADRGILLTLNPIPEEHRRSATELWAEFNSQHPAILGALLDAVVIGLQRLPSVRLRSLPRMADFALWATACETAMWPEGTFMNSYGNNRREAVESVIESDPVGTAVRDLMSSQPQWSGTASDLLVVLGKRASEPVVRSKAWPQTPRDLAGRLRRSATALREVSINVTFDREGKQGKRKIQLTAAATRSGSDVLRVHASAASAASAASGPVREQKPTFDLQDTDWPTTNADAASSGDLHHGCASQNSEKSGLADAADAADDDFHPQPDETTDGWRDEI